MALFNSIFRYLGRLKREKELVYVLGDSHVQVFDYINKKYARSEYFFQITRVDGATALGMVNPNSKTNALEIFENKISTIQDKNAPLLFLLGEVDAGFVIWYRAEKYNESVESQLQLSVVNYLKFLNKLTALGYGNLYVLSVPLPTISDYQALGAIANLRKEIHSTMKQRTELTLSYNKLLKEVCKKNHIPFLDMDSPLLDNDTGVIKSIFLNSNPSDHHLRQSTYGELCYKTISLFLKNSPYKSKATNSIG
jgi:hypothetical protein